VYDTVYIWIVIQDLIMCIRKSATKHSNSKRFTIQWL